MEKERWRENEKSMQRGTERDIMKQRWKERGSAKST